MGSTKSEGGGATDYEGLLQQARTARRQDGERLERVLRLSKKGKLLQERGLLRAHREVWEKERVRLLTERKEVAFLHISNLSPSNFQTEGGGGNGEMAGAGGIK